MSATDTLEQIRAVLVASDVDDIAVLRATVIDALTVAIVERKKRGEPTDRTRPTVDQSGSRAHVQEATDPTTPTPVERLVDVLHRHVTTTVATIAAGLPSDRALRDVTGVTASCEQAVLGEVANGGPLTRQGLDVAVRRALAKALDVDEIARVLAPDDWRMSDDPRYAHLPDEARDSLRRRSREQAAAVIAHLTRTETAR
ncbi:hypothetical protein [Xylanimonas ulmi]|uniref:DUF222 domain-containing protein n=1 Tax=Xylanimonas ulmi TaxID=228973 RepID=A0A4Q7M3U8_9MICO|nr:hypothetical protein [Xylanibacterium ulmi]RZS61663.1 hypothetical protein EV386_1973 [Xylanibacterium ulmi]